MESRVKVFGHPAHQTLVTFPVGLLGASVLFDVLARLDVAPSMSAVAYWTLATGIVAGLVAAPFGLIDLMALPHGTRARRIGGLHGIGNVVVLALFIGSWWMRQDAASTAPQQAMLLSLAGLAITGVTAWLGGELVSRLGVGVSPHAHPDARSSLDGPESPGRHPPAPHTRQHLP